MRWYRQLIAAKYDGSSRRGPGRPPTARSIQELVLKFARENPSWGYTRLRDALGNLGHEIDRTTVQAILAEHGLAPAPERGKRMPWKTFIKAHMGVLAAMDFFNVEVLSLTGLVRYAGVRGIKLPAHSPDLNAYAERFVLSIKSECLNKLVLLGEQHLRRAVNEFFQHYHLERNHQGLDSRLLTAPSESRNDNAPIARRKRLGGLLNYYYRRAA